MLDAILRAAGLRSVACGNVGLPIVEAVMRARRARTTSRRRAVQLPAALHDVDGVRVRRGAQRRRGPPRLVLLACDDYAADKGRIYEGVERACVYNVADPITEELVREADVVEGARAIGFTLGMPGVGMVGVVDDVLADRAFVEQRQHSAAELCTIADLASPGPALRRQRARRRGAGPRARRARQVAVRDGLRAFRPDGHRIADVATVDEVAYVDDSKATNPHAARVVAAGLRARRVGRRRAGQGRRASTTSSPAVRDRLRGVVLLGRDRAVIAEALAATRARGAR